MNETDIINRYIDKNIIWDASDKWHFYTHNRIGEFINNISSDFLINKRLIILNAGSGGEEYGLAAHIHIHVDIVDTKIKNKKHFIVSSIETIDFNGTVDMVLCVGSVLNYVDPVRAIKKFSKLLGDGGYLLLEYEKSSSMEFVFYKSFGEQVALVNTFYGEHIEKIRVYSENYIHSILSHNQFISLRNERFHILSALVYRLTKQPNFATRFCIFDRMLGFIKPLSYFSANIICLYQKA